jgi:hypothetical protein
MRGLLFLAVMAAGLVVGGALAAMEVPQVPRPETFSYGSERLQALDFWRARCIGAADCFCARWRLEGGGQEHVVAVGSGSVLLVQGARVCVDQLSAGA